MIPIPSGLDEFVLDRVTEFHEQRRAKLHALKLDDLLLRKNPYLFRAKNMVAAPELVSSLMDAYLSSSEETMFGGLLERLAVEASRVYRGGWKSTAEGIDLEFDLDGVRHLVSIKSGRNWGNSSQHRALRESFDKAERVVRQTGAVTGVRRVVGMCYGKSKSAETGWCLRLHGQAFWRFLTDDREFYVSIVEPLGRRAREQNEVVVRERAELCNRLVGDFITRFCDSQGAVEWSALLRFNSGNLPPEA